MKVDCEEQVNTDDIYSKENRFQNQNLLVKIYRLRYYLLIPFKAIKMYILQSLCKNCPDEDRLNFKTVWQLQVGLAQMKMVWLYDFNPDWNLSPEELIALQDEEMEELLIKNMLQEEEFKEFIKDTKDIKTYKGNNTGLFHYDSHCDD